MCQGVEGGISDLALSMIAPSLWDELPSDHSPSDPQQWKWSYCDPILNGSPTWPTIAAVSISRL